MDAADYLIITYSDVMNRIDPPVCVIDDDPSIRESVEGLLRAEGLRVETYCSATEFLARGTPEPPSCLVFHVQLRGLSGIEPHGERLRKESHIPIIFLTRHGDVTMSVRA